MMCFFYAHALRAAEALRFHFWATAVQLSFIHIATRCLGSGLAPSSQGALECAFGCLAFVGGARDVLRRRRNPCKVRLPRSSVDDVDLL